MWHVLSLGLFLKLGQTHIYFAVTSSYRYVVCVQKTLQLLKHLMHSFCPSGPHLLVPVAECYVSTHESIMQ